jgi:hypothetical protein
MKALHCILLPALLGWAGGAGALGTSHVEGEVEIGIAVHGPQGDADGRRLGEQRLRLQLLVEGGDSRIQYRAEGRLRSDLRHLLGERGSPAARSAYREHADWRQLYVSSAIGVTELSLGWQQVVWGRADELRVLDQINPVDYRDGFTALLGDSRIALPMLRATRPLGEWEVELLWILHGRPNRAPAPGSDFDSMLFAAPDPGLAETVPATGGSGARRGGLGLRMDRRVGRVDTSLVALQSRQRDPVYSLQGIAADGRLQLAERFPAYRMLGGGLAIDPGHSLVFRTELAWFQDWGLSRPSELGHSERDLLRGLFGADYLWRNWLLSLQWQRDQVLDWQPGTLEPARHDLVTLSADASLAQDRITARIALAGSTPLQDDLMLQTRLAWRPRDPLRAGLQLDLHRGRPERPFGAYRDRNRLLLTLAWLF